MFVKCHKNALDNAQLCHYRFKSNKSMKINNNEIVIKSIQEEDIPLFDKWLDKEYIKNGLEKKRIG